MRSYGEVDVADRRADQKNGGEQVFGGRREARNLLENDPREDLLLHRELDLIWSFGLRLRGWGLRV